MTNQNKETPEPSSDPNIRASSTPDTIRQATKEDRPDESEVLHEAESLPEPARKMFQMQMAMMQTFSKKMPGHPFLEKLTPEHINKLLDYSYQDGENQFRFKSSNRWFHLAYTILGIGSLLSLIFYLTPIDKDLLTEFLKLLIVFASGLGSGYGLKSYQEKKR